MTKRNDNIKAIIFDMGGVLIHFDFPSNMKEFNLKHKLEPVNNSKVMANSNFLKLFEELNVGNLSMEEAEVLFNTRYNKMLNRPENTPCSSLCNAYRSSIEGGTIQPVFQELLKKLRAAGYHLALLTNIFYIDVAHKIPTLPPGVAEHFDFVFESCRLNLSKPHKEIFQHVLNEMNLEAENCVFLDDTIVNIESAAELGIHSIHVTVDAHVAAKQLEELIGLE